MKLDTLRLLNITRHNLRCLGGGAFILLDILQNLRLKYFLLRANANILLHQRPGFQSSLLIWLRCVSNGTGARVAMVTSQG